MDVLMIATIVTFLILNLLALIWLIIFLIFHSLKKKYTKYILENNNRIKVISEINKKYSFYPNSDLFFETNYDNKKIYDGIIPDDYLIYQLQFIKSKVLSSIGQMAYNMRLAYQYYDELDKIKDIKEYDVEPELKNKRYFKKVNNKVVNDFKLKPCTSYHIYVKLHLINREGEAYEHKQKVFDSSIIQSYLQRLNNKTGYFYNDRGIWDSVCKIERGKVTNKMRLFIFQRDGYRCRYCKRKGDPGTLEVDHIKPIAKGGKTYLDNLQTLCHRCNVEKGDKY